MKPHNTHKKTTLQICANGTQWDRDKQNYRNYIVIVGGDECYVDISVLRLAMQHHTVELIENLNWHLMNHLDKY